MNLLKNTLHLIGSALLAFAITSCNHSDPDPTPVIPGSSFSAKVEGKAFYGGGISASLTASSLYIQSTSNEGTGKETKITLSVNNYNGLRVYTIDSSTKASYTEGGLIYNAASGSINITTFNDAHVAGQFSFDATDASATREITNGSFDIYR